MGTLTDFVGVPNYFYRALFLKKRQTSCNLFVVCKWMYSGVIWKLTTEQSVEFPHRNT